MRTNFRMDYENITMIKGDTLSFDVEVFDQSDAPLTVDTAFFTCKKDINGITKAFQKSLGDGITYDGDLLVVRVAPSDTAYLEAGRYFYDLQLGVGSDIYTPMIGVLTIEQDVTD